MRQREIYHEHHKKILPGDLVWLHTLRPNPNLARKFQSYWSGPYKVLSQVANTLYQIESYGNWTSTKVMVTAAVDRLRKCVSYDPWTNQGIPVDIKAKDLVPYNETEEILGDFHASDFYPHVFGDQDELPFYKPDSSLEPRESTNNVTQKIPLPPRNDVANEGPLADPLSTEQKQVSTEETLPSSFNLLPANLTSTPKVMKEKSITVDLPVTVQEPVYENPTLPPLPEQIPLQEPEQQKRKRGRPKGSRTKKRGCSLCISTGTPCRTHCPDCLQNNECLLHSDSDRCRFCTRTRLCREHR